jgi:hypothetical protein
VRLSKHQSSVKLISLLSLFEKLADGPAEALHSPVEVGDLDTVLVHDNRIMKTWAFAFPASCANRSEAVTRVCGFDPFD